MPDYNKCVIYTIRTGEGLYVGSTCRYNQRKYNHKSIINNENSDKYNFKLYKTIRDNDGVWDMQPHSQYPCNSKMEMTIEEERIRKELKADLNMNSCFQTKDESREKMKNYLKNYRTNNKDKAKIQKHNFYIKNKQKLHEKFSCECGGKYLHNNRLQHFKSQKHLKYIKDSQTPPL